MLQRSRSMGDTGHNVFTPSLLIHMNLLLPPFISTSIHPSILYAANCLGYFVSSLVHLYPYWRQNMLYLVIGEQCVQNRFLGASIVLAASDAHIFTILTQPP